jgi:hypothetical protein
MNDLGRSKQGGFIVELSEDEYVTFTQLERALNGDESDWYKSMDYRLRGTDLSRTLVVIRNWTEGLFYINSLQNYINQLKNTLTDKQND